MEPFRKYIIFLVVILTTSSQFYLNEGKPSCVKHNQQNQQRNRESFVNSTRTVHGHRKGGRKNIINQLADAVFGNIHAFIKGGGKFLTDIVKNNVGSIMEQLEPSQHAVLVDNYCEHCGMRIRCYSTDVLKPQSMEWQELEEEGWILKYKIPKILSFLTPKWHCQFAKNAQSFHKFQVNKRDKMLLFHMKEDFVGRVDVNNTDNYLEKWFWDN